MIKYNPNGWRFYQKPGGPELYFLKPELSFTFFFFIFFEQIASWEVCPLTSLRMTKVLMKMEIKHPQAPQEAKKVVPLFRGKELFLRMRSAVAGLRQTSEVLDKGTNAAFREMRVVASN
ncbi:hypothetical protein [Flavobacterium sp. HJJ]|uniref:hypothetical protein n=1 Tax=Flavobacterium sp. HJJ TaxID=2783792 RepID=UPI00188B84E4|nr:hypothetical protein [Flavobacterium sp. HJJ]MBF4471758.1 hypothetical protein [Flavobacterium sp. HJJ]